MRRWLLDTSVMPIFYFTLDVVPTERNPHGADVDSVRAHCWVKEESSQAAYRKATYYVSRDEWDITGGTTPAPVEIEQFAGRDLGQEHFAKAERQTIALCYVGCARDKETSVGPFTLGSGRRFDLQAFLQIQKKNRSKGRCLHFAHDDQCNDAIAAHSLQKEGILRAIARDGHVYTPAIAVSSSRKNNGTIRLEQQGIGKVSTFAGFCGYHDSILFRPIDEQVLAPTTEQVALYAYRALCRELFVKENASATIETQLAKNTLDRTTAELFRAYQKGTAIGLTNLQEHKERFDAVLREESYQEIEYTLFAFAQQPVLAFSAVFFPEFDFLGRPLQNITDEQVIPDLMTICSAQMANGWGVLFAWHKTSTHTCSELLSSLASSVHIGRKPEETLLHMIFASAENLAIAPDWWETRDDRELQEIYAAINIGANIFAARKSDYLSQTCNAATDWTIDTIHERIDSRKRT